MSTNGTTNGTNGVDVPLNRAEEVKELLDATQSLIIPFIAAADDDAATKHTGQSLITTDANGASRNVLVEQHAPKKLEAILAEQLKIREDGGGKEGLVGVVSDLLKYSVNTWDQGFMDKLYGGTNAVGLAADLVLAALNTNAHIYQVSPALTLIEKHTTKYLASLFDLPSPHCGGISQPGGSASNSTAIVIARNTLYPDTKTHGNGTHNFTLFTSAHGHYSVEKAANMFGLGSANVISVPVDEATGCMVPSELDRLVTESKSKGQTPFFVNATAGTTVQGSFDPFTEISAVCKTHNLWLHIDGSWGGSVVFNPEYRSSHLKGAHLADSIAITPHKMLGVPMTCSFLLGRDLRQFWKALTLPAGYLFHNSNSNDDQMDVNSLYDLGDLTPQCGRRADSLKLFLALQYYGSSHFSSLVDSAYQNANFLLNLLKSHPHFVTISPEPLPCLQVCFYFARNRELGADKEANGRVTESVAKSLIQRGFMIDYAPGEKGKFFRVVVNGNTRKGTLEGLVKAIENAATELSY